jgi:hypothetical protein
VLLPVAVGPLVGVVSQASVPTLQKPAGRGVRLGAEGSAGSPGAVSRPLTHRAAAGALPGLRG